MAIGLVVIAAGGWFLLQSIGLVLAFQSVKWAEDRLKTARVYQPVGRELALYCQTPKDVIREDLGDAWLPQELSDAAGRYCWARVEANRGFVECGGGFHHFGYDLERDAQASTDAQNVWLLYFRADHTPRVLLTRIVVAPTETFTADTLVPRVVARYDQRLARDADDEEAWHGKIRTLVRYDRIAEARKTCADMLKASPEDWWANVVNALVADADGRTAEGEAVLKRWVQRTPNFFSYLDLAYYYQLIKQPDKAAAAMVEAAKYDADTEWGHGGNSEYRGYTAAMYAYESGQYDAADTLCDMLLEVRINGDYAKQGLRYLKAVIQQAREGNKIPVAWDPHISPFDPFESIDIDALLQRKVDRPGRRRHSSSMPESQPNDGP